MSYGAHQQWAPHVPMPPGYGPVPPLSTRTLTVAKWITVTVSVLLTGLAVLWVMQLRHNVEFLEGYKNLADRGSGDGQGLKGGEEAIAHAETSVLIGYVTLAAIVLLGICALIAGTGQQWARVLTAILTLGPMGVVVFGALEGGSNTMYALVFLIPFIGLLVLWCAPGVSRGIAAKRAARTGWPRG